MTILIIFGTRPEAIKLAPIIQEFKKYKKYFTVKVCITSQHKQMLQDVLSIFNIKADYDLNIMKNNQDLFSISSDILNKMKYVLEDSNPDLVLVHGDTTTAFVSSLASFYKQIDVAHIEAGLRTNNMYSPYPEEINRQFISKIAKFNFSPTKIARNNLLNENIENYKIIISGNTIIDTLKSTLKKIRKKRFNDNYFIGNKQIIVVTLHRRENIEKGLKNICQSLKQIAKTNPNINIVYSVHMNPKIKNIAYSVLSNISNIFLIKPLPYDEFVNLMNKSILIVTDSGGIQEEAINLGKPLIITRETTERVELLKFKGVKLVGTSQKNIIKTIQKFIDCKMYKKMKKRKIYGDGKASAKVVKFLQRYYYDK